MSYLLAGTVPLGISAWLTNLHAQPISTLLIAQASEAAAWPNATALSLGVLAALLMTLYSYARGG